MKLCSIGELALVLGVSISTLRRWDSAGKLKPAVRTVGHHRRYDSNEVCRNLRGTSASKPRKTLAYARVSSHDQKLQLQTQAERLRLHCEGQGWTDVEIISDLGSGMNCAKKELSKLLSDLLPHRVERLVLVTKDRLLRFGADLILKICALTGVEVVILDEKQNQPLEQQLVSDLISIMTVFTSKLYGSRSRKNLKAIAPSA